MAFYFLGVLIKLSRFHIGFPTELGAGQDEGIFGQGEKYESFARDDPDEQGVEVGRDGAGGGDGVVEVDEHEEEGEEEAQPSGHHLRVDQEAHPTDHHHEGAGGKVGGQIHPRVSLQGDVEP